ncbi:hypothetical protein GN958_ATG09184 [Phytophthora infestans]|uniref:Uncharacterized protein n=1 Tax=Phytophthora infestans TaxID=4787 RepID=A0A8S9UTW5_PHYIN|nr:hypothetical protein GN958_ATG09184 [Phytophthora infestans]
MSLSGRQQILLSIYGAANEKKKKSFKKPQRPITSPALIRRASSVRRSSPFVHTASKEQQKADEREAKQDIEDQPASAEVLSTPPPLEACVQVTETPRSAAQREGRQRKVPTTRERSGYLVNIAKGVGSATETSKNTVISLMLLFKADDTQKHKSRVDKDGVRHTAPELDDTGDFVRWLRCGSTDRSIVGCLAEGSVLANKPRGFSSGFQDFSIQRSHDHVCRSQVEFEQKTSALIAGIEQMSPLLVVAVNSRSPIGSFEIAMELTRGTDRNPVVVVLHSMNASGCFPKFEDAKKKIESIVLFEAKRSPREEIQIQICLQ